MSERDQPPPPPPGPPGGSPPLVGPENVSVYTAGHVPGVSYRKGYAHSPDDDEAHGPVTADQPIAPPQPLPRGGTRVFSATPGGQPPNQPPGQPPRTAPRPAKRPPERPAKKKRRRSPVSRFFRWFLSILLVLVVALGGLAWFAWGRIEKVDAIPENHGDAISAGRVYLIVGSDSREDLTDEEQSELGTGSTSGQRTDTIMLLHLPTSGRPALISVPRDSIVDIPGRGAERVNAAFAFGGAPLLVETLEANTGVAIDDYVQIGFGGFAGIVDALGGVEMCFDEPVVDEKAHLDLPAGCQVLTGPQALGYARARGLDPTADLGRVTRQRELISAIADKALSLGSLVNPLKLAQTAFASGDALVLDDDTGPLDMVSFIRGFGSVSGGGGDSLTVPLGRVGNTVDWDEEKAGQLWTALRDGTAVPAELLEEE